MIWNDTKLRHYAQFHGLVTPFDDALINPASLDLRLATSYRRPDRCWSLHPGAEWLLTTDPPTWGEEQHMPADGILLLPGQFALFCSEETVFIPVTASAILYSKSSAGRQGIEHLHAGYVDPGFRGQLTFELKNVAPWSVRVAPGQRLMQMTLHELVAPAQRDYSVTGRYQNQVGATPARKAE